MDYQSVRTQVREGQTDPYDGMVQMPLKGTDAPSTLIHKDVMERRQWALMQALAYDRPFGSSDMEAAALRYLSFLETGSFGESAQ